MIANFYATDATTFYRAPSSHPLHVTQLSLILNRTDSLLNSFADGLENQEWNMKQE